MNKIIVKRRNWVFRRGHPSAFSAARLLTGLDLFLHTQHGHAVAGFLETLSDWQPYLIGGLPRELLIGDAIAPDVADIDFIVGGCPSKNELFRALHSWDEKFSVQRNRFGGAKLIQRRGGLVFDVWRIEDHLVPRQQPQPRTISDVLPNCLTNVDAIAIDLRRRAMLEHGCLDGLRQKKVRLLHPPVADPLALVPQQVHLLLLWDKYARRGFSFDREFIRALSVEGGAPAASILLREAEEKLRERGRPDAPAALKRMRAFLKKQESQEMLHSV